MQKQNVNKISPGLSKWPAKIYDFQPNLFRCHLGNSSTHHILTYLHQNVIIFYIKSHFHFLTYDLTAIILIFMRIFCEIVHISIYEKWNTILQRIWHHSETQSTELEKITSLHARKVLTNWRNNRISHICRERVRKSAQFYLIFQSFQTRLRFITFYD